MEVHLWCEPARCVLKYTTPQAVENRVGGFPLRLGGLKPRIVGFCFTYGSQKHARLGQGLIV